VNDDLFIREIISIEPDDGGSKITLACEHMIWCALEPVYQGGKMYCSICLHEFLERLRKQQRPA
jgi:hypothetical protein